MDVDVWVTYTLSEYGHCTFPPIPQPSAPPQDRQLTLFMNLDIIYMTKRKKLLIFICYCIHGKNQNQHAK